MPMPPFVVALIPASCAAAAAIAAHHLTGDWMWTAGASGACAWLAAWSFARRAKPLPIDDAEPDPAEMLEQDDYRLLALSVGAMPFGIVIVGQDRAIRFANPAIEEMFGLDALEGAAVATLRARRLLDHIETGLQQRKASVLEFTLSRRAESSLKAHISPISSGEVLVTIEDQTQTQRAGDLHRDFVANASHELKTPLAAVSGIIETLQGHARNDPAASKRFFKLLHSQTQRMTQLVEDLLSLNRIELNERVIPEERHDVFRIVSEAVDALKPIADANDVAITLDIPHDKEGWVLSDRDELGQVFGNLIDNAIKYGGAGSTVRVGVASADAGEGSIAIEVRDEGPGIAREHIPRLTERFYRVNVGHSRAKGGTGLGLAIVKHVLSRHRGRLEIDSKLGSGSCFRTILPKVGCGGGEKTGSDALDDLEV